MRRIIDHLEQRRIEFRRYSSNILSETDLESMAFEIGVDGRSGFISGRIPLDDRAFVAVSERLLLDEHDRLVIHQYSYYPIDSEQGVARLRPRSRP